MGALMARFYLTKDLALGVQSTLDQSVVTRSRSSLHDLGNGRYLSTRIGGAISVEARL